MLRAHVQLPQRIHKHHAISLVAARSSRNGPGASSAAVGAQLEGEQVQQLLAVQRHLLQVDQARARAVEDVELFSRQLLAERDMRTAAEQRAAALERRVQELESELTAASSRAAELEAQLEDEQQRQQQPPHALQPPQQPERAAPPAEAAPAQLPPAATVTLNYYTGWHDAFVHFSADGKGWTQTPGLKLERGSDGGNHRTITLEGSSVEFVMNNGHGEWDSPGRYSGSPSNYQITSPGVYKLKSGRLEKLPS